MILNSLKNFAKNPIYIFISMGIVYLFFLITVYILVSGTLQNLSQTISTLAELINVSVQDSSSSVNDFIAYALDQIDWNRGLLSIIKQIADTDWIQNTLLGFFKTLNASTEGFEEQFKNIADKFFSEFINDSVISIVFAYLGVLLANYATRFALFRNTSKRSVKKFAVHIVIPIVQSLIIFAFFILLAIIRLYSLLVLVVLLVLNGALSLAASWLIHRNGNVKLKDVLTFKNVAKHIAVIGIFTAINAILSIILMLINSFLAVLLMIPIVIYTFNVADMNTDLYVRSLIDCCDRKNQSAQTDVKPV